MSSCLTTNMQHLGKLVKCHCGGCMCSKCHHHFTTPYDHLHEDEIIPSELF